MSIEIRTEPRIEAGVPQVLFPLPSGVTRRSTYSPARDGKRFLVAESPPGGQRAETMVVVNWAAELQEKK
jgi:hypothetical protein